MKATRNWEGVGVEVLQAGDFEGTCLEREGDYAVCFAAAWCLPTRRFVPKFLSRNGRLPAKLALADISELSSPLWDSFQIKITPTMLAFRNGNSIGRFAGRRFVGLREADLDQLAVLLERVGRTVPGTATPGP